MEDWLSIFGESASAIWHQALSLSRSDLWAQIGPRTLAEDAVMLLALWCVAWDNNVANLERGDSLSNALYDGCGLVAENGWE